MSKNTINKTFREVFAYNIWKIEGDAFYDYLAIESREAKSTIPSYTVIDFKGNTILPQCSVLERDWLMEGIQKGFIILKKVGENTPVKAGIQVINTSTGQPVFITYEYQLLDVYEDFLLVRHRSFVSGNEQFIAIADGQVKEVDYTDILTPLQNRVLYPVLCQRVPPLLATEAHIENLWLSKIGDRFAWCYHQRTAEGYDLILSISDLNQVLYKTVILKNMLKMIPQPYFQIDQQLFFLSYNKREILSYLV